MHKFVDDDIEGGPLVRRARSDTLAPTQHHRATGHGLPHKALFPCVDDARLVDNFPLRKDRPLMHHDPDEALIALQPQAEHWQACLRGHGQGNLIGHNETSGPAELLGRQKGRAHPAQLGNLFRRAPPQKGIALQGDRPPMR